MTSPAAARPTPSEPPGGATRAATRTAGKQLRVLLAGDDELVITGVRSALAREDTAIQALGTADRLDCLLGLPRPDLYVVCLEVVTAESATLLSRLAVGGGQESPPVLVLAGSLGEWSGTLVRTGVCVVARSQVTAAHVGALAVLLTAGFLPIPRDDVRDVLAHGSPADDLNGSGGSPIRKLTRREREILELVRLGMTNPQIADALHIARSTVKSHIENILDKLDLRSRIEIIRSVPSAGS